MNKKVSIIIPCFNQGEYIKEAINSALNQTYKNIEIICINDGSTDNSAKIINEFKNIKFINFKENKGVIYARNYAIDASCGEYILPLDADDTIEATYVEKTVEILNNNLNIGMVYCKARLFGNKNKIWDLPKFNYDNFLYNNCIFNCSLFRKSDFYKAGKYKENMKNACEDWDLWISFIELGLKPYQINEVLFNYRQHKNARTKTSIEDSTWKVSIFKNHINSYLSNENFLSNIFFNPIHTRKALKKYKKLYNLFLYTSIFLFIIILVLIIK